MENSRRDTDDFTRALGGQTVGREPDRDAGGLAILILIAHPEHEGLGSRVRFETGSTINVGRDPANQVAHPEVLSLSREHARLCFTDRGVTVEDLGSTNGTFVNDRRVNEPMLLASGDRIQFGALHYKFVREADVEAAYHEAIHQLVMQDGLTEIGNRRRFDEELSREFTRAKRHERPLSVVVFDIDRFKQINDRHGHLCGDAVLKQLARICLGRLRSEQVLCRLGGDEFAILCPETELSGARVLAERMRAAIAEHSFETEMTGDGIEVTCSFGCAELTADVEVEADLVDAADRALYDAKEAGRNRVGAG